MMRYGPIVAASLLVVARIDPTLYQAAYDQALAKMAQDEATLANARGGDRLKIEGRHWCARRAQGWTKAAGLAIVMGLGGCAENYFQPTLTFSVPEKYQAANSIRPTSISKWWTRFGSAQDVTLLDLLAFDEIDAHQASVDLRPDRGIVEGDDVADSLAVHRYGLHLEAAPAFADWHGPFAMFPEICNFFRQLDIRFALDALPSKRQRAARRSHGYSHEGTGAPRQVSTRV